MRLQGFLYTIATACMFGIIAIAGGVIAVSGEAFPKRPTEVPGKNRPGRLAKTLL